MHRHAAVLNYKWQNPNPYAFVVEIGFYVCEGTKSIYYKRRSQEKV